MAMQTYQMLLKDVILSHGALFEAKSYNGNEAKFSGNFLFSKDDEKNVKTVTDMIDKLKKENFKEVNGKPVKINEDMNFFRDGDEKSWKGYAGNFYVVAKNRFEPVLQDKDGSNLRHDKYDYTVGDKPKDGDIVNVMLKVWAATINGKPQIGAYLVGVQFVKKGERFISSDSKLFDSLVTQSYEEAQEAENLFGE